MNDVLVHYVNKLTGEKTTAKLLSQCSKAETEKVNLRRSYINEVILDIEKKEDLANILEKLKESKWSYKIWNTGSRGYHISICFEELEKLPLELRDRYRRKVIDEFGTDTSLASECHPIAIENKPHFKTGNLKTLHSESESSSINHITFEVLEILRNWNEQTKESRAVLSKFYIEHADNEPYLLYVLNNKVENGGRHMVLFKNLVALLQSAGKTYEEIMEIGKRVMVNCPDKNMDDWIGWFNSGMKYIPYELNMWAVENNCPAITYSLVKGRNVTWVQNLFKYTELEDLNFEEDFSDFVIDAIDLANEEDIRSEFIVDDVVEKNTFTIFAGDAESTKSFFALIIAIHSLSNKPLFYKEAKASKIIYVDEENGLKILKRRFKSYCKGKEIEVPKGLKFISFKDVKLVGADHNFSRLKRLIKKEQPDLIILDSLVRLLVGDENFIRDVRVMFDCLKPLKEITTIIALHHANKPNEHNRKNTFDKHHLRGSSDFQASPDAIIEFIKGKADKFDDMIVEL